MKLKCLYCKQKEANYGFYCSFECEHESHKQLRERLNNFDLYDKLPKKVGKTS